MTTDSHSRGSERSHIKRRVEKYAKVKGIEKMSQEGIDREKAEISLHLELLMDMLQMNKEDQRYAWAMKRKVKWHRLQVQWDHRVNAQLKEELLRISEYVEKFLVCKPKHGPLISKSNEEIEENTIEDLNHMKDSEQQGDLMAEASSKTTRSYVLKTDNLCMFVGVIHDDGQSLGIFKEEEVERHLLNSILKKKGEIVRSHEKDRTYLEEDIYFLHTTRVATGGILVYMGIQRQP